MHECQKQVSLLREMIAFNTIQVLYISYMYGVCVATEEEERPSKKESAMNGSLGEDDLPPQVAAA